MPLWNATAGYVKDGHPLGQLVHDHNHKGVEERDYGARSWTVSAREQRVGRGTVPPAEGTEEGGPIGQVACTGVGVAEIAKRAGKPDSSEKAIAALIGYGAPGLTRASATRLPGAFPRQRKTPTRCAAGMPQELAASALLMQMKGVSATGLPRLHTTHLSSDHPAHGTAPDSRTARRRGRDYCAG